MKICEYSPIRYLTFFIIVSFTALLVSKSQETPTSQLAAKEAEAAAAEASQAVDATEKAPSLTNEQLNAVVTITGDTGCGTGFVSVVKGKPCIITNQHVLVGQSKLVITNASGITFRGNGFIAAKNADIALITLEKIPDGVIPLSIAEKANELAQLNDSTNIPGNSKGDGVITVTPGKVIAFGPQKIEISNPVFAGNSGSPIIHSKSGKVIGVLTEATLIKLTAFDKAAQANPNSQIKSEIRYFGHRIDMVTGWETLDWKKFSETSEAIKEGWAQIEAACYLLADNPKWKENQKLVEIIDKANLGRAKITGITLLNLKNVIKQSYQEPIQRASRLQHYYIHKDDITRLQAADQEVSAAFTPIK